ncbi:hypothetical protein [Streptomyces sp. NRRL F-5650]|uniref:hypothetical protein n=1 Tax=Streptomyces sp. NRRL F-5650 TaxID=1463868 RepID=UPI000AE12A84|nr:hypothetical protein [Streptomyces sp. NRRL F-5650]
MDEIGLKQMADRAVPLLTGAGYRVSIDTVIGGTAYRAALAAASQKPPTLLPPGPPAAQDQRMRRSP